MVRAPRPAPGGVGVRAEEEEEAEAEEEEEEGEGQRVSLLTRKGTKGNKRKGKERKRKKGTTNGLFIASYCRACATRQVYCQGGDATCVWWGWLFLRALWPRCWRCWRAGALDALISWRCCLQERVPCGPDQRYKRVSRVTDESSQNVVCLGQHFGKPAATNRHTGVTIARGLLQPPPSDVFSSSTFNFITNYDL